MASQTSKSRSNSKIDVNTPIKHEQSIASAVSTGKEKSAKSVTETIAKSLKIGSKSSSSLKIADDSISETTVEVEEKLGEEEHQENNYEEEGDEQDAIPSRNDLLSDSELTWSEPDVLSYASYSSLTEEESIDKLLLKEHLKFRESTDRIYLKEDAKETWNKKHGYTLVETSEEDTFGTRVTRKFYPRIAQKIKSFKQLVPMRITYNKLTADETDVVEEEDVVDEEMEVDEITDTILIKTKNAQGEDVVKQRDIMKTNINDPSQKKKYLKLKMINDSGQFVEEIIELNDDPRRTNDILKAAAPYLRKKLKDRSAHFALSQDIEPNLSRGQSVNYTDWVRSQNSLRTKMLNRAIENLKRALDERKTLVQLNRYLGKQLCHHFDLRGKKDPDFKYWEKEASSEEEKANYQSLLLEFNDVVNHIFTQNAERERYITSVGKNVLKASDELNELRQTFYDLEEFMVRPESEPGTTHYWSRNHLSLRPLRNKGSQKQTHQDIINQQKLMDTNLSKVRFEFLKSQSIVKELKNKEAEFQESIGKLEKVDFVNYEILRAKTKDLNDKLDLKDKQVMAMKDTMTQRVQALAHVRLKKEYLAKENDGLREEMNLIVVEQEALRMENIKVRQKRRKLEKQLNTILEKEGIEKYPYLAKDALTVASKHEEQKQLLSDLVIKCTEMKGVIQRRLDVHQEGAEKYQEMKRRRHDEMRLFSFDFK